MNRTIRIIITTLVTLIALFVVFVIGANIYLDSAGNSFPKTTLLPPAEFEKISADAQLPQPAPIYHGTSKLGGCSPTHSAGFDKNDCTYASTYFYVFTGDYRTVGQAMFSHLKSKGFDFKDDEKSRKEVDSKLHNNSLADNLSNAEPIVVDLYNQAKGVRVRVFLGDKGRTLPDVDSLAGVSDKQLVGSLQFFQP